MAINLNDNIYSASPKPLDAKYLRPDNTPYTSIAEVNSTIPEAFRSLGLTVLINTDEYWYQFNTTNSGLVIKTGSGAGNVKQVFVINGNGIDEIFTINHTLNTLDISNPRVMRISDGVILYVGVSILSTTQFTVDFGYIPPIGEDFTIVVWA